MLISIAPILLLLLMINRLAFLLLNHDRYDAFLLDCYRFVQEGQQAVYHFVDCQLSMFNAWLILLLLNLGQLLLAIFETRLGIGSAR